LGKRARSATVPVAGVHRHFGKFQRAGQRIVGAVVQLQRHLGRLGGGAGASWRRSFIMSAPLLLDVDIDRVENRDGGQRIGLIGGDQRALRGKRTADPPGERRRHGGVAQVDARGIERGAICATAAAVRAVAAASV
jgi:hypothetical protein